MLPLRNKEQH